MMIETKNMQTEADASQSWQCANIVEFINRRGGYGSADWVADLSDFHVERIVQALDDAKLAPRIHDISLELIQGGVRHSKLYSRVLETFLQERNVAASGVIIADAAVHKHNFPEEIMTRFFGQIADPELPGNVCWPAIEMILSVGIWLPSQCTLSLLRKITPPSLMDVYVFLCSRIFQFDPNTSTLADIAMASAARDAGAGRYDDAIAKIVELGCRGFDQVGVIQMLIQLCVWGGDKNRAISEMSKICQRNPENIKWRMALSEAYVEEDDLISSANVLWDAWKSIKDKEETEEIKNDRVSIAKKCAWHRTLQYRNHEDLEQAVECYRAIIADGLVNYGILHNLGLLLVELGYSEEAFAVFRQIAEPVTFAFWPRMSAWPDIAPQGQ